MKNGKNKRVVKEFDFPEFLAEKEIISLISDSFKRRELEFIFRSFDTRENSLFLKDLAEMTGTAGEWKILSEKFENRQLKAVAVKKHKELMAIASIVQKKESFIQTIVGFFKNLTKKSTA